MLLIHGAIARAKSKIKCPEGIYIPASSSYSSNFFDMCCSFAALALQGERSDDTTVNVPDRELNAAHKRTDWHSLQADCAGFKNT